MLEPLSYPFRLSTQSILFQSSCSESETITSYKFNFICSSDARSHGSLFCLFLPISAEEPSASVCGLVQARSCDTGVTSMGRRTDARLCLIGSAHFPSLEQNGEKKDGIWQTVLSFI